MSPRILMTAAFLVLGCQSESETETNSETIAPAPSEPNATANDRGVMTSNENAQPQRRSPWQTGLVEDGGVGLQAQLAKSPSGTIGAAYFVTESSSDGPCNELGGDTVPDKNRWTIRYAEFLGGEWRVETVHEPILLGVPVGLSLAFAPDDKPTIATMTGEPLPLYRFCGANDVGLLTRENSEWRLEAAAVNSGNAAINDEAADFGEVVGYWPALAYDAEGQPAIAYRDVHSGSIMRDDLNRADLEFAWKKGGGWTYSMIDPGMGAGEFNALTFDNDGRPLVLYSNPVEQAAGMSGLWIARANEDEEWTRARLSAIKTSERPSITVHPNDGSIIVAFHDVEEQRPYLATLEANADFQTGWSLERLGDNRYASGQHPSVAFDPNGFLAAVWYRCGRQDAIGSGCDAQHDALIFGWFVDDEWIYEVVDPGGDGLCGNYPDLVFDGEGRAIVTYQCSRDTGDGFEFELNYARREVLR